MIPDQAVEAAWKVYLSSTRDGLDVISNMLEAAAPHMLAQPLAGAGFGLIRELDRRELGAAAWSDALQYVYEEGYITRAQQAVLEVSNPHRPTHG